MTTHTFSKLDNFETCPRQYHARYVAKSVAFVPSEESKYGDRFHEAMEQRICFGGCLPEEFRDYEDVAATIDSEFVGDRYCEIGLAVDKDFRPCVYNDPNFYIRGVIDYLVVDGIHGRAFDWKTGKVKRTDQITLMALLALANFPQLQYVRGAFVFFRYNDVIKEVVLRRQVDELWNNFKRRFEAVESAIANDKFIPKPSGLCRKWCPVTSCEFNGQKT